MRANIGLLAITMLLAAPAANAQPAPAPAVAAADCQAELAAAERDMEVARSRGQMLRRRQLAEAHDALQARCGFAAPPSREAQISKVEQEIRELRTELDRAKEALRKLKSAVP